MTPANDKNLLPEFESIKDDKEEILWTGKPKFIPFIFTEILGGIFAIGFAIVWLLSERNWGSTADNNPPSFFWLFGLIPLVAGLFTFLKKIFSFSNMAYSYSDKRVMMRSGFIGTEFASHSCTLGILLSFSFTNGKWLLLESKKISHIDT